MSHKPLKRIKTKDKNYVLGDVLGEGVPCHHRRRRRRRLSCSARTRMSAVCCARLTCTARVLHVSLPSAGAFGQVREGMRVDQTGNEFGRRVAVKIISRRLIKKVSSPRAGPPPHPLQRAGAILDPMERSA